MFTKRKFLSFSKEKQHKKLAEILKDFSLLSDNEHFEHYNEIQLWLGNNLLQNGNRETISDRYHYHLKQAKISLKEHNLLPQVTTKDCLNPKQASLNLSIYLDNLRSSHNVGSIVRTVEAFQLGKIFFSENTPYIDNEKVKKTSMGTFENIECSKTKDLSNLPKPIICLETSPQALSLYDFIFPDNFSLVVGNEEYGCSEKTLAAADILLEIPMRGRKNSLNAANAFAIAAAEIIKQRTRIK